MGIVTGVFSVAPDPNASKDQEWRQESGWGYPGILAAGVALSGLPFYMVHRD